MTRQSRTNRETILVLGGTGKTGRRVAERLRSRNLPVRIGSRSGEPLFDWDDRSTWAPVLRGASAAYVSYFPDLAVPGAPEAVAELAQTALDAGVRRLVLLSGRGEEEAQKAEMALAQSGAEWTVVRASWFNQNFSESVFLEPVLDGQVALPVDAVAEPFVDADDIADVAVLALTQDGHEGQVYEVTGPRLLRFDEAVAEIAAASGRDISYLPMSIEEWSGVMKEAGVPADELAMMTYLFTEVLDGRNAYLTDDVQRALGRPPEDFADYARQAAATGVWNVDN